jgi:hypothetical protein
MDDDLSIRTNGLIYKNILDPLKDYTSPKCDLGMSSPYSSLHHREQILVKFKLFFSN